MKSERQEVLMRKMRRALIGLRIQTPQPVLHRISKRWYFSAVAGLVLLMGLLSTRAALMFRAEVEAANARVVSVQKANSKRRDARVAALIAHEQRTQPVKVERVERANPPPLETGLQPPVAPAAKREIAAQVKQAAKPEIILSSRYAEAIQPQSVDAAFRRLVRGEDQLALNWLQKRPESYRGDLAWGRFQQLTSANSAQRHYQIGVLHGALGNEYKAYRWSSSAASLSDQARYIRSYAVAADRLGLTAEASLAYQRYLRVAADVDLSEITARIAVLELQ